MRIRSQADINAMCEIQLSSVGWFGKTYNCKRLRHTQAFVVETGAHFVLLAEGKYVALISKTSDILYDVAEKTLWRNAKIDNQIDKFEQDYSKHDGGCQARFTWAAV